MLEILQKTYGFQKLNVLETLTKKECFEDSYLKKIENFKGFPEDPRRLKVLDTIKKIESFRDSQED